MLKIPYQKNSGKIILQASEFKRILSNLNSKKFEFEEVEFLSDEEELSYDEAMSELTKGESIKYDDILRIRAEKNVRN